MRLDREKLKNAMVELFPNTKEMGNIEEALDILVEYGPAFGVKTELGAGMLLAQMREEIGSDFRADISESLNYSADALPKLFKAFRADPLLAEKYGRTEDHKAHQRAIANISYANRIGNGAPETGDGWTYRGKGALQLTGRSNYHAVQRRIDRYAPDCGVDIMDGMDGTREGLFSALGFWIMHDLYEYPAAFREGVMDTTEAMNKITEKINKHTDSYEKRVAHFDAIAPLLV